MLAADLYQIAEDEKIPVLFFPMPQAKSMALSTSAGSVVGLDCTSHCSEAEECVRLGHELGHCCYGGFYDSSTPFDLIAQHEHRADAWFIRHFIPWEELSFLLSQGYLPDEIAEKMNITEEYVHKAYYFYKGSC